MIWKFLVKALNWVDMQSMKFCWIEIEFANEKKIIDGKSKETNGVRHIFAMPEKWLSLQINFE